MAAQIVLIPAMLAALFVLRLAGVASFWPESLRTPTLFAGGALLLGSAALLVSSVLHLGSNLTAFPRPLNGGSLVQSGAYAIVRHPIYTSIIAAMLGLALVLQSTPGLVFAVVTFAFFDRKAAFEEAMLANVYADYDAYRRRVHKLIPFLY